jgi:hypothetical protein
MHWTSPDTIAPMTDRDMAIAIADKILTLRSKNAAMASAMDECLEPNWRKVVAREAVEAEASHRFAYEFSELSKEIDSLDGCTSLLRILHQYILSGKFEPQE